MKARVTLAVGGLLAVAALLNYAVVEAAAPGMGSRALWVSLSAAVAATLLTLWLTARYDAGVKRIAAGLSEVGRGRKDLRFDPTREPMVDALARAANEAVMALAETADPALGPVRTRKRQTSERIPVASVEPVLADPAVGNPVPSGRLPARPNPTLVDPPAERTPPAEDPLPPLGPDVGPAAAPTGMQQASTVPPSFNISSIPMLAAAAPESSPGNSTPLPRPASVTPDPQAKQQHYAAVFAEYCTALNRVGQPTVDLTAESFSLTLAGTEQSLVEQHGCRAVRFSVLVENGRVQLLPRLVR